ncbi:hypothetical protein ACLXBB_37095, partial [Pseudomonas aeruginosa]
ASSKTRPCCRCCWKSGRRRSASISARRPATRFGAEPPARLNNIYLSFLEDPTLLPMLLEERPAAVSFHFGAPPRDQVR